MFEEASSSRGFSCLRACSLSLIGGLYDCRKLVASLRLTEKRGRRGIIMRGSTVFAISKTTLPFIYIYLEAVEEAEGGAAVDAGFV